MQVTEMKKVWAEVNYSANSETPRKMNTLEAEFKAFLEDILTLALDEFLAEFNLSESAAERLGRLPHEDIDRLLRSLSPHARASLVVFSRRVLASAQRCELWDHRRVLAPRPSDPLGSGTD
jgi:hypothetical protein